MIPSVTKTFLADGKGTGGKSHSKLLPKILKKHWEIQQKTRKKSGEQQIILFEDRSKKTE